MSTKTGKRLEYIDIAKGIGIILVIIGHGFRDEMRMINSLCEFVYTSVYFFHMPLFFAISGVTFGLSYRKYVHTPKSYLTKRVKTQFVPVLAYATAIYLCFFVAYKIPALQQALVSSGYLMYSYPEYLRLSAWQENPYSVHLWYLWVLFIVSVVAYVGLRRFSEKGKARFCFTAVTLAMYFLPTFIHTPAIMGKMCENAIFFALGILLSSAQHLVERKSVAMNIYIAIGWAFALGYSALVAYRYEFQILNQPQLFALLKLLANVAVVFSVLKISCKLTNVKLLKYFGKESYTIYLLHQPFCCGFVGVILYNTLGLPIIVVFTVCCALSVLVPAVVVAICRKNKVIGTVAKHLFNVV